MNIVSNIVVPLIPLLSFLASLVLISWAFKLYYPTIKGWFGEQRVRSILAGLNAKSYRCFHDVLLPIDGDTTQIDHIVIAGNSCFVIETKAYDGWIYGSARDGEWTQSFNRNSRFKFQNPLRQNYKHILAVKNFVGDMSVVGVVVFTQGTFKSERIDSVLYANELKSFLLKNVADFSFDNEASVQSLTKAMIREKVEHRAHVRRLQEKHGGRWRTPAANVMLVAAVGLFALGPGLNPVERIAIAKPVATPSRGVQNAQVLNRTAAANRPNSLQLRLSSPKGSQRAVVQQESFAIPRVNGFAEGKAVVWKGKEFGVLRVSEATSDGWTLVEADTRGATFLHSSGQTVRVGRKKM